MNFLNLNIATIDDKNYSAGRYIIKLVLRKCRKCGRLTFGYQVNDNCVFAIFMRVKMWTTLNNGTCLTAHSALAQACVYFSLSITQSADLYVGWLKIIMK